MSSRTRADQVMRALYFERYGDVPYDAGRDLEGHRVWAAMKALERLELPRPDQDQALKQYMTFWDDSTYGGLARYLANVLARRPR